MVNVRESGLVCLLTGAPTKSCDDGPDGNFFVVEAASKEVVDQFVANDPFVKSRRVANTEIRRMPDQYPAEKIAETLSPGL